MIKKKCKSTPHEIEDSEMKSTKLVKNVWSEILEVFYGQRKKLSRLLQDIMFDI